MMKQFCQPSDDCVYGADGKCVFCDRRGKAATVKYGGHEEQEVSEESPEKEESIEPFELG